MSLYFDFFLICYFSYHHSKISNKCNLKDRKPFALKFEGPVHHVLKGMEAGRLLRHLVVLSSQESDRGKHGAILPFSLVFRLVFQKRTILSTVKAGSFHINYLSLETSHRDICLHSCYKSHQVNNQDYTLQIETTQYTNCALPLVYDIKMIKIFFILCLYFLVCSKLY